VPVITLTPGYNGPRREARRIDGSTPRALVLLGSFRWSAKQTNLRNLLDHATPILTTEQIGVRIVGDMASDVRRAFEARYRAASFTGFVEDPTRHLDARLAVLAEPIGGGFKLKLLDYIFNRVPVAALETCCAGFPKSVREHMIIRPDINGLLRAIVEAVDDFPRLNRLQERAFAAAERAFEWRDRGILLRHAVECVSGSEAGIATRARSSTCFSG
jgi:hypothetical protein